MELNGLNQAAPEGFIQTEFGVIPELWNVISIDEALCKGWLLDQMDGNHGELYPKSMNLAHMAFRMLEPQILAQEI